MNRIRLACCEVMIQAGIRESAPRVACVKKMPSAVSREASAVRAIEVIDRVVKLQQYMAVEVIQGIQDDHIVTLSENNLLNVYFAGSGSFMRLYERIQKP